MAVSQCVHYFEWRTYAACKNNKFKPQKEVGGGHVSEKMRGSKEMAKLLTFVSNTPSLKIRKSIGMKT